MHGNSYRYARLEYAAMAEAQADYEYLSESERALF